MDRDVELEQSHLKMALHTGMLIGNLSSPEMRRYFLERGVTAEEIDRAKAELTNIAKAFYWRP